MENDLFELVARAQDGDKEALVTVISYIAPAIHGARCKMKGDRQDDLEQVIIETVIKKIMSYDLHTTPDFTDFCRHIDDQHHK
ncbi:hypothetical protein PaecuDRAFT_4591 [Paenibacillus curdlanolyticus YK9]|uniref:Helix-turn-helix conjugative transposon-like domain-containing protein n=1 Tax=Paenibacillus curdlanolyticus YK9 TaxID=717606 RepID=E0IG00_9BACL|nr:helix-turn-helix domain-containing protein [Paenibacillus curdlanolyticus]EFM08580.1 hypothetical protein PaecuDRAFT_4591 [Paenibacillus curdlanolyticus YK9]